MPHSGEFAGASTANSDGAELLVPPGVTFYRRQFLRSVKRCAVAHRLRAASERASVKKRKESLQLIPIGLAAVLADLEGLRVFD